MPYGERWSNGGDSALRSERPCEQCEELLFAGVAFMVESDAEVVEALFYQKAAEETIPEREHAAVVRVVFAPQPGVVQPVHHGGGNDQPDHTLEGERNGDVAVVELDDWRHEKRVEQQVFDACPHQHEERKTQQFREQDFHVMKPPAGGDVERSVAVVYGVESPEKDGFVVEPMPGVHPQVDEKHHCDCLGNGMKAKQPYPRPEGVRPAEHESHEYARREQDQQVEPCYRKIEFRMLGAALLFGEKGVESFEYPEQYSRGNGGAVREESEVAY